MNWAHILRFAWKDYRRMAGLCIAMAFFWIMCLGIWTGLAFYSGDLRFPLTIGQVTFLALATAVVYTLAWAGLTFSVEHEDKTYGFIRALPVKSSHVFFGKLCYGLLSTALLLSCLALLCFTHFECLERFGGAYETLDQGNSSAGLEFFGVWLMALSIPWAVAIGFFCSLSIKRPLLALLMAAIFLVVLPQSSVAITAVYVPGAWEIDSELAGDTTLGLALAAAIILSFSCVVFLVDYYLARRWLPNYQSLAPAVAEKLRAKRTEPPQSQFRRMIWLGARQNLGISCLLGLVGLAAVSLILGPSPFPMMIAGMLGVLAFRPDHKQDRYRLLSQLGVSTPAYWMGRLLIPGLAAIMIAVVRWKVAYPAMMEARYDWLSWSAGCTLVAFSVGQFCSLAFGSTIIATAATLIGTLLLCGWASLCAVFRIPTGLIFSSLVLLPLLGSYLRIPRWFRQTRSWKQWLVPMLPLGLLFFGVPLATALYRVYEVPSVQVPDELILPPRTPEQQATINEYEQLYQLYGAYEEDRGMFAPDKVDRLLAATKGAVAFPDGLRYRDQDLSELISGVLLGTAEEHLQENELDAAWECLQASLRLARQQNDGYSGTYGLRISDSIMMTTYPVIVRWAAADDNTVDKIKDAIAFIEDHRRRQLTYSEVLAGDYAKISKALDPPIQTHPNMTQDDRRMLNWLQLGAWEVTRSRRLRDYAFSNCYLGKNIDETKRLLSRTSFLKEWISVALNAPSLRRLHRERGLERDSHLVARGTICQLIAIADRKNQGSYGNLKQAVSRLRLPEEFERIAESMKIATHDDVGPFICDADAHVPNTKLAVDASGKHRIFLLPHLGHFDPQRFMTRMHRATADVRARIARARETAGLGSTSMSNPNGDTEQTNLTRWLSLLSRIHPLRATVFAAKATAQALTQDQNSDETEQHLLELKMDAENKE